MILPKHVIEKIERECIAYVQNPKDAFLEEPTIGSAYQTGATIWAERCMKLKNIIDDFLAGKLWTYEIVSILEGFDEEMKK